MTGTRRGVRREIEVEIDRAIEELTGAILLVPGGRFPSVVISNLARCREAMEATRAMADEADELPY